VTDRGRTERSAGAHLPDDRARRALFEGPEEP